MNCRFCSAVCIKKGKRNNIQKYFCKQCHKYQQAQYSRKPVGNSCNDLIVQLNNEGVGISSIARIINTSKATVIRKIKWLASQIIPANIQEEQQVYEIDELRTCVGNKKNESWVVYAINRKTKKVVASAIGKRNTETINKVVKQVLSLNPRRIITDGLNIYASLIPQKIHTVCKVILHTIERKNLTLRTHLKRLNRRTICFSKSEAMLDNAVKLYFN